jgi:hypothetical protein
MTDTSNIQNKYGTKCVGRVKQMKWKKCTKQSIIIDQYGVVLSFQMYAGNKHDSSILVDQLTNNDICAHNDGLLGINNVTNIRYFLADAGYDSKAIRTIMTIKNIHPIIPFNKRNTKDPSKIKILTDNEKEKYNKRIKIENVFSHIKKSKRLDCLYEKTIESYKGFFYLNCIKRIIGQLE